MLSNQSSIREYEPFLPTGEPSVYLSSGYLHRKTHLPQGDLNMRKIDVTENSILFCIESSKRSFSV